MKDKIFIAFGCLILGFGVFMLVADVWQKECDVRIEQENFKGEPTTWAWYKRNLIMSRFHQVKDFTRYTFHNDSLDVMKQVEEIKDSEKRYDSILHLNSK